MKLITVLSIFLGAIAHYTNAQAASFSVLCDSVLEMASRGCAIKLTGKIEAGDASRLRQVLQKPLSGDFYYMTLLLDSAGGDVREALLLAQVVREAILETSTWRLVSVPRDDAKVGSMPRMNWPCVSACFLVWVAGTERKSMSGVSPRYGPYGIGLHRPFLSPETYKDPPSKVVEKQQAMTTAVREYLRREQVPEPFIDKMLGQSSREIYWLGEREGNFALNDRAAWFEEMMIARCAYDPAYDRESQARDIRRSENHF